MIWSSPWGTNMKNDDSSVKPAGTGIDWENQSVREAFASIVSQDSGFFNDKLPDAESSKWISDSLNEARTTLPAMSVMWALRNVKKIWELLPAAEQLSNNSTSLSKFELIFLLGEIERLIHENPFQPERSEGEFYLRNSIS